MFTREEDMYPVIKSWLKGSGHVVRSEVCKCDIVSEKNGLHTIYEMKLKFGLDVIYQALERMTSSSHVYIVVPIPEGTIARKNWDKNFKGAEKLCRRLGVGLIVIYPNDIVSCVVEAEDVWFPRKSPKKHKRLVSEFSRRSGDYNVGGINKKKLVTAYQEDSLRCLNTMLTLSLKKPSEIKKHCNVEKTGNILLKNVYGWFSKDGQGLYSVSEKGYLAFDEFQYIIKNQKI